MSRPARPSSRGEILLLLFASAVLLVLANGRFALAPVAWIAPVPLLRLLRRLPLVPGVLLGLLPITAAHGVMWHEMIPVPGPLYFAITSLYALFYYLPFVVHRAMVPRLRGFVTTLVFPCAWIAMELPLQRWVTPYGSWGSVAYTQLELLPLVQIVSVTGLWGLTFLIAWFASTVDWLWAERFTRRSLGVGVSVLGTVLGAVLLFGSLRLGSDDSAFPSVRVAGLTPDPGLEAPFYDALKPMFRSAGGGEPAPSDLAEIERLAAEVNSDLLDRSRLEARAGAEVVAWSETAARTLATGEHDLLTQARDLAASERIFLLIAYISWSPGESPPLRNKAVLFDPAGTVLSEYLKSQPIAGAESPLLVPGDGVVPTPETPHGRLATAICHDLDFPELLRSVGREGVEVLFAPSADWSGITPLHAEMAVFRALEQGFALIRPTSGGLSLMTDSRGRRLAVVDDRREPTAALVGQVPLRKTRTIYALVGDLFAWLATIGLVALALSSRRRPATAPGRPAGRRSSV